MKNRTSNAVKCASCGYVKAPVERGDSCVQCVQRAARSGGAGTHTPPRTDSCLDFGNTLETLLERGDGWLRIKREVGGETYFKWRFTWGEWAGFYVLYVSTGESHITALTGLARKLAQIDRGERRPSRDVYR